MKSRVIIYLSVTLFFCCSAFAQKSANDCDLEIPKDIRGKQRQRHIQNCLLTSLGLPPLERNKIYPDTKFWKLVAADNDSLEVYLNKKSIKRLKSMSQAWLLYTSEFDLSNDSESYKSYKILSNFDCVQGKIGSISIVRFEDQAGNGKVTSSFETPLSEVTYSHVVPQSIGEATLEAVCSK